MECYRTIALRDNKTNALYSDLLEIQILELKKLPKEPPEDNDVISWMRFFSGKKAEDFEHMAEKNAYIREAYDTLLKLSADDQKRLEYDAREKAIRDYEAALSYARKEGEQIGEARGIEIGEARGEARGENKAIRIISLHLMKKSNEEISGICDVPMDDVERVVDNYYRSMQAEA